MYLTGNPNPDIFTDVFDEVSKINQTARQHGFLSLANYESKNSIIKEFIRLIIEFSSKNNGSIDICASMILPKILYGNYSNIDFIKTVLLFEGIILTVKYGYDMDSIEYILNNTIRK